MDVRYKNQFQWIQKLEILEIELLKLLEDEGLK